MSDQTSTPAAGGPGFSNAYKGYALFLLVAVYTSNFIDRQIVSIIARKIQEELKVGDFEIGLLSGLAFAVFYSLLGLPIARLAERFNRVTIIAVSLALWSAFTAACGLAQNFVQLFLLRVGVGIGEAGCSPAAQSLLSDYYPPNRRATALAIFSLGIPFGSLFGAVLGGQIAETYGWRETFFLVGLPGLLLALVVVFTLKEPKRGTYDPPAATDAPPPMWTVFKRLFGKASFRHMAAGSTLACFASYAIAAFGILFLVRGPFELSLSAAAGAYGLFGGLAAAVGVLMGGVITDLIGKRSVRSYALVPGVAFLLTAPLYVAAFLQTSLAGVAVFIIAPLILQYLFLGPTFAVTHNLVEPRMRASATALLLLPINLVGLGFGPPFLGWLSDMIAKRQLVEQGYTAVCKGGVASAGAAADLVAACAEASFDGVKWAIIITAGVFFAWTGVHFLLASRTLKRDLESVGAA